MIYLLLAVLFGTLNAALVKIGELQGLRRGPVVSANYVWAALLAGGGWAVGGAGAPSGLTVGLGVLGGVFYAGALFLWMGAVARAGVAVSTTALRMAVIWPTLLSVALFAEVPTPLQAGGIALALAALGLLSLGWRSPGVRFSDSAAGWLLATFLVAGGGGTILKVFTELGMPAEKPALLALIFLSAGLQCWLPLLWGRVVPRGRELAFGSAFGVFNVAGNACMLIGLEQVPGVVAFPLTHAGTLVGATLLGVLVWRERPGPTGWAAIGLSACAILLMQG